MKTHNNYSRDLNTKLVWYSNGGKEVGRKWFGIQMKCLMQLANVITWEWISSRTKYLFQFFNLQWWPVIWHSHKNINSSLPVVLIIYSTFWFYSDDLLSDTPMDMSILLNFLNTWKCPLGTAVSCLKDLGRSLAARGSISQSNLDVIGKNVT